VPEDSIKVQRSPKEAHGSALGLIFISPPKRMVNFLALLWAVFSSAVSEKFGSLHWHSLFGEFYHL